MDNSQLKNGKYFVGKYTDHGDFQGWFVGSFFGNNHPSKTDKLEILYKEHQAGDKQAAHYHKEKVELLIMLDGKANYNINGIDVILEKGNYLFVDTNNIISGEFLEPSKIFAIHSPSLPKDKFSIAS